VKKETVEQRRIEILEATCDVIIERGFAGTRVADVAKRLGVSNSLIHYHFASKEELLAAAFEHYANKDLADMQRDSASAPTAVAKLWRLIESYVPEGSDDVEWMLWIDAWGEALRNPKMKPISQELDAQSIAVFEKVLRAGNESGEFHCVHPRESATRISGLIDGLAVQYAAHEGVLKRKEFIRLMRQLAAAETGLSPDDIRDSRRSPKSLNGTIKQSDDDAPRPASLATDFDLRQLITMYADALSRSEIDSVMRYFTDDAVISVNNADALKLAAIIVTNTVYETFLMFLIAYALIEYPRSIWCQSNLDLYLQQVQNKAAAEFKDISDTKLEVSLVVASVLKTKTQVGFFESLVIRIFE
jgi:AcrR family transcriptional regulator